MEPESPSPYPQVPATCPCPEPTPSSPHDPLELPEVHTQFKNQAVGHILQPGGPRVGNPWYKFWGCLYENYRQTDVTLVWNAVTVSGDCSQMTLSKVEKWWRRRRQMTSRSASVRRNSAGISVSRQKGATSKGMDENWYVGMWLGWGRRIPGTFGYCLLYYYYYFFYCNWVVTRWQ